MAFVKLDTGILRSTIWFDKEARDVFITALLMAEPMEIEQPMEQIAVRSLDGTGWSVPPGWYGFVPAAGIGILSLAGVSEEVGYPALERLGNPEPDSRSQDFEGRRLVRIDGGYLVLNFMRYREKDHTAAMRMRRLRARKRDAVTASRDAVTVRTVTEGREQSTEYRGQRTENGATSLPSMQQGGSLEGGMDRIALRLTMTNQVPREPGESLQEYRERIDALLAANARWGKTE